MNSNQSTALRRRIVIIFLLIGLVPLFSASVLSFLSSQKTLKRVIGKAQRDLAVEVMDKIDREIDNAQLLVRNWISIPEVLEVVLAGSQRSFDQLQSEWQKDGLTSNLGAKLLKKLQSTTQGRFKEIFVTDSRGYVIAATSKTTDFDQGPGDDPPFGETWWKGAIDKGEHIGHVDYDESAEVYSVDINMSIRMNDGRVVGVIKAVYNMENILSLIGAASKGEAWHYELINKQGRIVATKEKDREKILIEGPSVNVDDSVWRHSTDKSGFIMGTKENEEKVLVGWSRGSDDFDGLEWTVLAYIPEEEAYAPLNPQKQWFIMVSLITLVVILAVSLILANKVVSEMVDKELLAQELQAAHNLQMGLLPETPDIKGLDLAGRCLTANHVGGDYYNYLCNTVDIF